MGMLTSNAEVLRAILRYGEPILRCPHGGWLSVPVHIINILPPPPPPTTTTTTTPPPYYMIILARSQHTHARTHARTRNTSLSLAQNKPHSNRGRNFAIAWLHVICSRLVAVACERKVFLLPCARCCKSCLPYAWHCIESLHACSAPCTSLEHTQLMHMFHAIWKPRAVCRLHRAVCRLHGGRAVCRLHAMQSADCARAVSMGACTCVLWRDNFKENRELS